MNIFKKNSLIRQWVILPILITVISGCGDKNPVPVRTGVAPIVTNTSPLNDAASVSVHSPGITATFNQTIAVGDVSFAVTCSMPCVNPDGKVEVDPTNRTASFIPTANLAANTLYTVAVTKAKGVTSGVTQDSASYIWHFTTGVAPFPITVTTVVPIANATDIPINSLSITAEFNEPVAFTTEKSIFALTCDLPCVPPSGKVTQDTTNKIIIFTLTSGTSLTPLTVYTATVNGISSLTTGAALASPFVWHFTTEKISNATH